MTKNLLHHPDAITEVLSCRPCGLMTDVDGTISDIAPRPSDAIVSDSCRTGLAALAGSLDLVAVVSGRPAQEALRMVGLPDLVYVGDHGLERMRDGKVFIDPLAASYQEKVRAAAMELFWVLSPKPDLEGLFLEDKKQSFSFHYRQCPDPVKARRLILEALSRLDAARGLQITEARRSVEVRPPLEVNKGTALEALSAEHGLRGLFYMGDDYTDVSAFRALRAWRGDVTDKQAPGRRGFPAPTHRPDPIGNEYAKGRDRLETSPPTAPGGQGRPPLRSGGPIARRQPPGIDEAP
ncbi:MAG: trehalose-phosphatase, partial [Dehalococcoidia bacterium]|nr:trehalose-phosphatase [Dehalococcoidia bacterium]